MPARAIVRIDRIYTRGGDAGETSLVDGARVRKDDLRVQVYGEMDELNAAIGALALSAPAHESELQGIQSRLFDLGAYVAAEDPQTYKLVGVNQADIDALESRIDALTAQVPALTSFVLPGGSEANVRAHLARTICRRAERSYVALAAQVEGQTLGVAWVNRLSDFLFALGRAIVREDQASEILWVPRTTRNESQ